MITLTERSDKILLPDEVITSKIFLVRQQKVMLDRDLAELFDVKSIRLREQVKRNIEKLPSHFMFQLTNEEVEIMVSQNAIPSKQHLGGSQPYVFTEHGVLQDNQDKNIELIFSYLDRLFKDQENPEPRKQVSFRQSCRK